MEKLYLFSSLFFSLAGAFFLLCAFSFLEVRASCASSIAVSFSNLTLSK